MNKLVEEIIKPILEANSKIKKVVGIYGGRFQPFGPHHYKTYKWLEKQVDEAYITTSNIKKPPRHPMNFKEKVRHMSKMGVKSNRIIEEKSPYVAKNLEKKFNKETTAFVYVFGAKDAGRLGGGGKYFQDYKKNKNNLKGYGEHGYYLVAPHVSMKVGGKEVSGTTMRELLGSDKFDDKERAKLFKKMFGYYDKGVFQMMTNKFKKLFESIDHEDMIWEPANPKPPVKKIKDKAILKGEKEEVEELYTSLPGLVISNTQDETSTNLTSQWPQRPEWLDNWYFFNSEGEAGDPLSFADVFPGVPYAPLLHKLQDYYITPDDPSKEGRISQLLDLPVSSGTSEPEPIEIKYKKPEVNLNLQKKKDFNFGDVALPAALAGGAALTYKALQDKKKKKKDTNENIGHGYPNEEDMKKIRHRNKVARANTDSNQNFQFHPVNEDIKLPVEIGDTILMGKFKNKKVVVKTIDFNDKGDLLINGRPALKFRMLKEFFEKLDMKALINEATSTASDGGAVVDDGPSFGFGGLESFINISDIQAKKLGFKIVDFIMKTPTDYEPDTPKYKNDGAVSYGPAGVGTGRTPNNQVDLTGGAVWTKWNNYIQDVAKLSGYKFMDYLLDKDIIKQSARDTKDMVKTRNKENPTETPERKYVEESFTKDWWKKMLFEAVDDKQLIRVALMLFKKYNVNPKIKIVSKLKNDDFAFFDFDKNLMLVSRKAAKNLKQFLISVLHEIDHARDLKKYGKRFIQDYEKQQNLIAQGHIKGKKDPYWDNPYEIKAEKFGRSEARKYNLKKLFSESLTENVYGDDARWFDDLHNRKGDKGRKLDYERTNKDGHIIGVEHGQDMSKEIALLKSKIPVGTKVAIAVEGGTERDPEAPEFWALDGEQSQFRDNLYNHYIDKGKHEDKVTEFSWDENANVFDPKSKVYQEVKNRTFRPDDVSADSKTLAAVWSNMTGQDGPKTQYPKGVTNLGSLIDEQGKRWLNNQAEIAGLKFDDPEFYNPSENDYQTMARLNYGPDEGDEKHPPTEVYNAQRAYNDFRREELVKGIEKAETAGYTVLAAVGNEHVNEYRKIKQQKKPQKESVNEDVINEVSAKVKLFKQKLMRRGITIRYDKVKAEQDLIQKYGGKGRIAAKKFGLRKAYYAVPDRGSSAGPVQQKPTIKITKQEMEKLHKDKVIDKGNLRVVFSEGLLLEGGAYGHMAHPFDDKDLTFGDLKKIIELGLGGQLSREDNVTEKLDGQNIMISWKDGKLIAARNKGHIKNAGKTALDTKGIMSKFKGRGDIRNAFVYAMRDLEKAIKRLSQKQKDKIFNEGQHWMNMEVMWPKSANVIDYDKAELVFHGALIYDDNGNVKGEVKGSGRILSGMIEQANQHIQKKYKIGKPVFLDVPKHQDFSKMKGKFLSRLNKLQAQYGLKDNDTLALYHQMWWEVFISNNWPKKLSTKVVEGLVKRWAFFDKSYSVADIKKDMKMTDFFDEKALQSILDFDKKNHAAQVKKNMKPFETLFFEVGAEILKNVKGFMAANPSKAVQGIRKKLDAAIKNVRSGGDIKKLKTLKLQLDKLKSIGGTKAIVPSEGIVFKYKGKTYKFTGAFAPINQITGLISF